MIGAMLISASVITACGTGNTAKTSINADAEEMDQLGSMLDQNPVFQEKMEEVLYVTGDDIVITQAEMDWKVKANAILNIADPKETAYESLSNLKSEYAYAFEKGYECTEEEIDVYCDKIRNIFGKELVIKNSILTGKGIQSYTGRIH